MIVVLYRIWQIYSAIVLIAYEISKAYKIAKSEDIEVVAKEFLKGIAILPLLVFITIQ